MPANRRIDDASTSGVPMPSTPKMQGYAELPRPLKLLNELEPALDRIVGVKQVQRGDQRNAG